MKFAADFEVVELQGKTVKYHLQVSEIRERVLPELDRAFFEKIKVKDLEAFKKHVLEDLRKHKLQTLRFEQREAIVKQIIERATFEIPESAESYEQMQLLRNFIEQQLHGGVKPEIIQQNQAQLVEDTKKLAHDRAKINFILEKIAAIEKIVVTEDEMQQMIYQEAAMLRISPDQLVTEIRKDQERIRELQRRALFGKTLDFILTLNLKKNPVGEEDQSAGSSPKTDRPAKGKKSPGTKKSNSK
jgi:trigger factor